MSKMRADLSEADREKLRDLYWEKELTLEEIAGIYDVCRETIRKYIGKFGIPRRSRGDSFKIAYRKGRKKNPNMIRPNLSPSATLAYILGVMVGDGNISESRGHHHIILRVRAKDLEFVKSFQDGLKQIGIYSKLSRCKMGKNKLGWRIRGHSKVFCGWYKSLTFEQVAGLAQQYPQDFMRGFYESEGSYHIISRKRPLGISRLVKLTLCNTDKRLAELARDLIETMGFHIYFYPYWEKGHKLPIYRLYLKGRKSEKTRFLEEIRPVIKDSLKQPRRHRA